MKKEPRQFSADIEVTSQSGTMDEGNHAARLTVTGLPTVEMADRISEWLFALVEKNLQQAMSECAPKGSELVEMYKPGDNKGASH